MKWKSFYAQVWRCQRFLAIMSIWGGVLASTLSAESLTASVGYFDPDDSLVSSLYNRSLVHGIRLGLSRSDSFDWVLGVETRKFESRVNAADFTVNFNSTDFGFQQFFPLEGDTSIASFFGAGINLIQLSGQLEEIDSDFRSDQLVEWTNGSYFEVGLVVSFFEFRIVQQSVTKNILGNINLGGRITFIGFRYDFGS